MENTAQQCRLGLFQDSDFAGDLQDSKSTSGGILCIFGSHTFVPTSWMCKKQTSMSHSSTEAEIISLDAGLRMDGNPALGLCDLVIEAFHSVPNRTEGPKREPWCLKPDDPDRLLYFRAIQGHSGKSYSGNAPIDPALQDNVLLPKDFTKYVYHIGSGKELKSTVNNGLIPGGFSNKMGRQAVFCRAQGRPFANYQKQESRLKKFLETISGYIILCKLLLAQEKRFQFYQTMSDA